VYVILCCLESCKVRNPIVMAVRQKIRVTVRLAGWVTVTLLLCNTSQIIYKRSILYQLEDFTGYSEDSMAT